MDCLVGTEDICLSLKCWFVTILKTTNNKFLYMKILCYSIQVVFYKCVDVYEPTHLAKEAYKLVQSLACDYRHPVFHGMSQNGKNEPK